MACANFSISSPHHSLQTVITTKVCTITHSRSHGNGRYNWKPSAKHTLGYTCISQSRTAAISVFKLKASSAAAQETENDAEKLVDTLLSMVKGTDRGTMLSKEEHAKIAGTVSQLEQFCISEPLKSPLIFGDWDVEYSSNPTSTGGYYRSVIGRLLLRTKEMAQTIQAPDFVGNKVAFSALNAIDGEVSLKGPAMELDFSGVCLFKSYSILVLELDSKSSLGIQRLLVLVGVPSFEKYMIFSSVLTSLFTINFIGRDM
ncbi:hypothetical protein KI387_011301 [Taxus chinensis]|uniref:Plastid lipid-associated protein/fibrillin conserved domain-containing protein n=1 Tax=Taxus chinensis TaxID=29808 RepID=A0AA38FMI9_TAXCH|nr:hypothetical protein KI387_011301 [Taxus chinensis]